MAVPMRGEAAGDLVSAMVASGAAVVVGERVDDVAPVVVLRKDDTVCSADTVAIGAVVGFAVTGPGLVVVDAAVAGTAFVVLGPGATSASESGGFGGSVPEVTVSGTARIVGVGSGSTNGRSPGRSINWIHRSTTIGVPGDDTTSERPVRTV